MTKEQLTYVVPFLFVLAFVTIPLHVVWLGWILVIAALAIALYIRRLKQQEKKQP
jgi:Na+-driven multidrug efflux pump